MFFGLMDLPPELKVYSTLEEALEQTESELD